MCFPAWNKHSWIFHMVTVLHESRRFGFLVTFLNYRVFFCMAMLVFFFFEIQYRHKHILTLMSTSDILSPRNRTDGFWDWRNHRGRLAIDGNIASHWKKYSNFIRHQSGIHGVCYLVYWVPLLTIQQFSRCTCLKRKMNVVPIYLFFPKRTTLMFLLNFVPKTNMHDRPVLLFCTWEIQLRLLAHKEDHARL
jgi:hypothetical protein